MNEAEDEPQPGVSDQGDDRPRQEGGDSDELVQEDGEDVQKTRKLGNPKLPSADEIDDHCKTHLPYRCWCKH